MTNLPRTPRNFPSSGLQQIATAALGVALIGASRRGRAGSVLRLTGAALVGLAIRPLVVKKIRDAGERRRLIAAHRSIEIERPIAEVFAFFKDFESFPRVIGALRSVIDHRDGRSRWEIYTPSGNVAAWDVVVTKYVPNSVIAWESVPNSTIQMRGIIRFVSVGPRCTRVDLDIVYRPARTGLHDAVHALVSRRAPEPVNRALEKARFYLESLPAPAVDVV